MNNREFFQQYFNGSSPIFNLFMSEGVAADESYFTWNDDDETETLVVQENPETFDNRNKLIRPLEATSE
ncbi:hypothetical protein SEA_PABST_25 [Microbacterium phage Pabst]|nr:hypothetical protein SEA_PABST_25 [Microbacterium phage Pabst]